MSGHSHWATIRHKKGVEDAKRGKLFSKLNREVLIAIKEGGSNPDHNARLRMAIERAREYNMPKDNIDRLIKKATGEKESESLEEFIFEILGPKEMAILAQGITDNKNRALGDIKKILTKTNAKLVAEGALRWMFEKKGEITVEVLSNGKNREELEIISIEAGADDIQWSDTEMFIYTKPEDLEPVRKKLEEHGVKAKSASLSWIAKEQKKLDPQEREDAQKLLELLDDNDDVQELYTNVDLGE